MQTKKFNHNYENGIPLGVGDRYYAQDLSRDNRYLQTLALRGLSAIYDTDSGILNGLQLTKKSESLLGLTAGIGYCHCAVTIVDDDQPWTVPPQTKTEDILGLVDIETQDIQITPEMKNGSKHYVKAVYKEKIVQSRTRQASDGSYGYVVADDYEIKIDEIEPTKYEVLLGTFQGTNEITVTGEKSEPSKIPDNIQKNLSEHISATTGVHGAVSTATANKIIIRDATGRAQVANPSANNDIANKAYTDTGDNNVRSVLNSHTSATTGVHGATSAPTANKIAIRDASGRLKVNDSSDDLDATNKQTVVSLVNALAVSSWTAISDMKFETESINSIAYGNGKFVAVGSSGKGSYSNDGITWTAISDMKFGIGFVQSVTYGNGKFVAADNYGKGSYSTDGITWTAISDMKFGGSLIRAITYGNGKFVAADNSGKGAYSSDGVTWTAIGDMKFGSSTIYAITYGNGKFVAVGNSGKGSYSTDGITWTAISDMKLGTSIIRAIAYGNGKFVATGNSGKGSYSTDGITWTAISDMKLGTSIIRAIAYGNGKFVATGNSGKGSYSTDGITWTAISDMKLGTSIISSIAYGNGKFVVAGRSGKGSYSLDLIS